MGDFPILLSVARDESVIHCLKPEDMDALGQEISVIFQHCTVPESQLGDSPFGNHCKQSQAKILSTAFTITKGLSERSENSTREGALRMLFLKTIITSKNLQALFRMCDPSIRTGDVRCYAIGFLHLLSESTSTWSLQIPSSSSSGEDEEEQTTATPSYCSFGRKHVTVMMNALTQKGFCNNPGTCDCVHFVWASVAYTLEKLILKTSEPNAGMLELLDSYDWPVILQSDDVDVVIAKKPIAVFFYDIVLFMGLHKWACRLLLDDNDNDKAKTFLREKLGSCHEFFRRVLRRVITGELYSPSASSVSRSRLDEMETIRIFIQQFLYCLVPVPIDRETKSLVRRAQMALAEALHSCPVQEGSQRQSIQNLLLVLDNYQCLNNISDQYRWELFYEQYLSARSVTFANKMMKKFKKDWKEQVKVHDNLGQDGEMCANCFVLEKTLLDESNQTEGLMKCNRCRQMKYCSRECQLEHWKKAHKKQCKAASSAKTPKP